MYSLKYVKESKRKNQKEKPGEKTCERKRKGNDELQTNMKTQS